MTVGVDEQFGIISDLFGTVETVPTIKIKDSFMPDSENVYLDKGTIRAMPGGAATFLDSNEDKVQTPDGNTIIHYHRHVSGSGIEYAFAYTKANVYLWSESGGSYTLYFTCSDDCTLWDTASVAGKIVSTNNVDLVQVWDETTPGTLFADLGGASGLDLDGGTTFLTKAAYLTVYENYLLLQNTTEGGSSFTRRMRWSSFGDVTDFDESGSGDTGAKDFDQGYGALKGFGHFTFQGADLLIIFKERTHFPMWLVESLDVWRIGDAEGEIGLLATHSVVNDGEGRLFFIASDYTVRQFRGPVLSGAIDTTMKGIPATLQDDIEAAFMPDLGQIWWSIPSNSGSSGNDKVIARNIKEGGPWHHYTFAIRAFGIWSQQSSLIIGSFLGDGLDTISTTIDGLDASMPTIDTVASLAGTPLDLGSGYDGFTYSLHTSEQDMGVDINRYFVLATDLSQRFSTREFKFCNRVDTFMESRSVADMITISVKRDNEPNWQVAGSLSMQGIDKIINKEITPEFRAKHFLWKGETTKLFAVIAQFYDFAFDGKY